NDLGQEFFAVGITEQLITDLSKIRGLRVIPRTSAMHYRAPNKKTPAEIARELGVAAIVEGSVLRSGEKVRITARLIGARKDHYLWGESYARELGEGLDLQRDVAGAIAHQIRATVVQTG